MTGARASGGSSAFAWVLNLDADDELCAEARGARFVAPVPAPVLRARIEACMGALAPLVGEGVVLGHGDDTRARGLPGRAFCPTPSATASLVAAGAEAPPAPPLVVIVRANHRSFSAELGQRLDGGTWVRSMGELESAFAGDVLARGGEWVLKHPHGYVGRNRHRTRELDPKARSFARRAIAEAGGLQLEPWVARSADYAIHGFVAIDGSATFGAPTRQVCDGRGVWQGTSRETDLAASERGALEDEAERTARALAAIGYFGPFGVDAFRYVEGENTRFCARCEVNARYTMGWAIGMGTSRPDVSIPR